MKIKELVSKINIPMVCMIAITVRIVVFGANIGDSLSLIGIVGLLGYLKYLNKSDQTWMRDVQNEVKKLRDAMTSVKMQQGIRKTHERPQDKDKRWF